jgi:hypothetical protein
VENHICFSHGVQVIGVTWWVATRIVAGVGDMVQMTRDGRIGRLTLCAVCTVHMETRSAGFLVEPQNQGRWFVSGLTSKLLGQFSSVWPQNQWRRFLPV